LTEPIQAGHTFCEQASQSVHLSINEIAPEPCSGQLHGVVGTLIDLIAAKPNSAAKSGKPAGWRACEVSNDLIGPRAIQDFDIVVETGDEIGLPVLQYMGDTDLERRYRT
jgi:hypothetical protein